MQMFFFLLLFFLHFFSCNFHSRSLILISILLPIFVLPVLLSLSYPSSAQHNPVSNFSPPQKESFSLGPVPEATFLSKVLMAFSQPPSHCVVFLTICHHFHCFLFLSQRRIISYHIDVQPLSENDVHLLIFHGHYSQSMTPYADGRDTI